MTMSATPSRPLAAQLDPTLQDATTETKPTDQALDHRDPVTIMLNIPELLEATLEYVPTKDLARSLRISKQWRKVILGSLKLRRILFLEPTKPSEWFGWEDEYGQEPRRSRNPRHHFVITNTESNRHDLIVEAHQVLKLSKSNSAKLRLPMMHKLEMVSPSTFVCHRHLKGSVLATAMTMGAKFTALGV